MAQASFEDWAKNLVAIVPAARKFNVAVPKSLWSTLVPDHGIQLKFHQYHQTPFSINSVNN